jgi:hypothetical protein
MFSSDISNMNCSTASVASNSRIQSDIRCAPSIYMHYQKTLLHFQEQQMLLSEPSQKAFDHTTFIEPEFARLPSDNPDSMGKLVSLVNPIYLLTFWIQMKLIFRL